MKWSSWEKTLKKNSIYNLLIGETNTTATTTLLPYPIAVAALL